FFFSSRRRHTRFSRDWSSDVCSSDLLTLEVVEGVGQGLLTRAQPAGRGVHLVVGDVHVRHEGSPSGWWSDPVAGLDVLNLGRIVRIARWGALPMWTAQPSNGSWTFTDLPRATKKPRPGGSSPRCTRGRAVLSRISPSEASGCRSSPRRAALISPSRGH